MLIRLSLKFQYHNLESEITEYPSNIEFICCQLNIKLFHFLLESNATHCHAYSH